MPFYLPKNSPHSPGQLQANFSLLSDTGKVALRLLTPKKCFLPPPDQFQTNNLFLLSNMKNSCPTQRTLSQFIALTNKYPHVTCTYIKKISCLADKCNTPVRLPRGICAFLFVVCAAQQNMPEMSRYGKNICAPTKCVSLCWQGTKYAKY